MSPGPSYVDPAHVDGTRLLGLVTYDSGLIQFQPTAHSAPPVDAASALATGTKGAVGYPDLGPAQEFLAELTDYGSTSGGHLIDDHRLVRVLRWTLVPGVPVGPAGGPGQILDSHVYLQDLLVILDARTGKSLLEMNDLADSPPVIHPPTGGGTTKPSS